jgi:hypothetical protein
MNEEYTRFFDNGTQTTYEFGYATITFIVTIVFCVAIDSTRAVGPTLILLIIIMMGFDSLKSKASFIADDTEVIFSSFGKDTVIRYEDISDLSIERRNNERRVRGGTERCYVETLTIFSSDENTYCFSAKLDIDYDEIANNPAYLTEQFENSEFSRLKTYIEEQKKLEDRLRRV